MEQKSNPNFRRLVRAARLAKEATFTPEPDSYFIWSFEHGAYWRPKAQGYTDDIQQAGIWPLGEAMRQTNHCGPEKRIRIGRFVPGPTIDLERLHEGECAKAVPPHGWFVYREYKG